MSDTTTRPRTAWKRALIAAGVALLVGVAAVGGSAAHVATLSSGRVYSVDDVPERGVGLVLGARTHPDRPSAFLAARLDVALRLFESGKVRVLLVSGDNLARSNHETTTMRRYLEERGVPSERIFEDEAGFDTYDSCVRARDVFGVAELTIVTQDYHLDRAIAICEQVGVDAVGVPDESARERFPAVWAKGRGREWLANLKMEWDTLTAREPQQDPFDGSLLEALDE
ncbi:SanA/YdcF family protein [Tessaracoccus caeni]|uniref:SanA/YdcF family protein n=1 Tax=Tessaracoccus caeni TaxID=3031239 RepID=UPI0023DB08EF|nr:ElyC/SanA/YdcF family protein [Tessaracoccus caeni]MDF1487271.1 ElyC/SanA/YdcF family protein [Tessaracoccus caeni]